MMGVLNFFREQEIRWPLEVTQAIDRAETWLKTILEDADFPITVKWEILRMMKTNDIMIVLRLVSPDVKVIPAGVFSLSELNDQSFAVLAFRELYLTLLRYQSDQLFHSIRKPVAAVE